MATLQNNIINVEYVDIKYYNNIQDPSYIGPTSENNTILFNNVLQPLYAERQAPQEPEQEPDP